MVTIPFVFSASSVCRLAHQTIFLCWFIESERKTIHQTIMNIEIQYTVGPPLNAFNQNILHIELGIMISLPRPIIVKDWVYDSYLWDAWLPFNQLQSESLHLLPFLCGITVDYFHELAPEIWRKLWYDVWLLYLKIGMQICANRCHSWQKNCNCFNAGN